MTKAHLTQGSDELKKKKGGECILFPMHGKISKKFIASTITS
jgi:hypothetical protein